MWQVQSPSSDVSPKHRRFRNELFMVHDNAVIYSVERGNFM